MLADLRMRYVDDLIRQKNRKKFFKLARSTVNSKVAVPRVKRFDETLCSDDEESAEAFAESFSAPLSVEPDGVLPRVDCCANVLYEVVFTQDLVEKYLSALDHFSSLGPDELSSNILKECADVLPYILQVLFSKTMRIGILPREWLISSITSVFKKGDKMLQENYRPISLISVASKVFERIILII